MNKFQVEIRSKACLTDDKMAIIGKALEFQQSLSTPKKKPTIKLNNAIMNSLTEIFKIRSSDDNNLSYEKNSIIHF